MGNWIKLVLKGVQAESHCLGSKIEVEAGGKKMIREIDGGGSSHIFQNSVIAHFGLGKATKIDRITVHRTGQNKQPLTDIASNQLITITEIPVKKGNNFLIYLMISLACAAIILVCLKQRKKA